MEPIKKKTLERARGLDPDGSVYQVFRIDEVMFPNVKFTNATFTNVKFTRLSVC